MEAEQYAAGHVWDRTTTAVDEAVLGLRCRKMRETARAHLRQIQAKSCFVNEKSALMLAMRGMERVRGESVAPLASDVKSLGNGAWVLERMEPV